MNIKETALVLAYASSVFPNYTLTEEAIKTWFLLFEDEDFGIFRTAMRLATKESGRTFFPTPGEITKIILELKQPAKVPADMVWCAILKFAAQGLQTRCYQWLADYPAGIKSLNRITFDAVRMANTETELPWLRKEFIQSYDEHEEVSARNQFIEIGRDEAKEFLLSNPETAKLMGTLKRIGDA